MNICLVEKTGNVKRNFTAAQMKELRSFGIVGTLDQIIMTSAPIMQALSTQLGIQNILLGDASAESKFDALCKKLRETSTSFKGCRIMTPRSVYNIRVSKYVWNVKFVLLHPIRPQTHLFRAFPHTGTVIATPRHSQAAWVNATETSYKELTNPKRRVSETRSKRWRRS